MTQPYLLRQLVLPPISTNCYLLTCVESGQTVIIDPASMALKIIDLIDRESLLPLAIINTHGHWDHIGANRQLAEHYQLPIMIHALDQPLLSKRWHNMAAVFRADGDGGSAGRLLADGEMIEVGQLSLQVLHTPGHSPGSICLYGAGLLFSGDTLFAGDVGRTDLPGGDEGQLRASIQKKLLVLPKEIKIFPGHGPKSSIGQEKISNPYL